MAAPGTAALLLLAALLRSAAAAEQLTDSGDAAAPQRELLQSVPSSSPHLLRYPPRPLPPNACACRVDSSKRAVQAGCPSPWESAAGTSKIPPALRVTAGGDLVKASSGARAVLHGVNWFGWETGTFNLDGLWAHQDNEVLPTSAVDQDALNKLGLPSYWKRTMTNDFAVTVHRIKALGFTAIRVPFNFTNLAQNIPPPKWDPTEFYPCMVDPIEYINVNKTLDPSVASAASSAALAAAAPRYTGMPHPPPARPGNPGACSQGWRVPFASRYSAPRHLGSQLQLTMCNWYLPQGPNVPAIHRFLWQVQYLVAQGFYVLIDHASYLPRDPNMASPELFAANWGNLWRMISELPRFKERLQGRVLPDLANEPSRWGCQWERECLDAQGQKACAPGNQLYHQAIRAIHKWDPQVPVFVNALGQAGVDASAFPTCANSYRGMNYGDGTITQKPFLAQYGLSDPSGFFKGLPAGSRGKIVLAPHVYPGTLSGWGESTQQRGELFSRLDLSFGLKALGRDVLSDGSKLPRLPAVIGEFGVADHADFNAPLPPGASDYTSIKPVDVTFLADLAEWLARKQAAGAAMSWWWWAWNANSGDTKGIVGPNPSWAHVQFSKVRLLSQLYGLRPWYCTAAPRAPACASMLPPIGGGGAAAVAAQEPWPHAAAVPKPGRPQAPAAPAAAPALAAPAPAPAAQTPRPGLQLPFAGVIGNVVSQVLGAARGILRPFVSFDAAPRPTPVPRPSRRTVTVTQRPAAAARVAAPAASNAPAPALPKAPAKRLEGAVPAAKTARTPGPAPAAKTAPTPGPAPAAKKAPQTGKPAAGKKQAAAKPAPKQPRQQRPAARKAGAAAQRPSGQHARPT